MISWTEIIKKFIALDVIFGGRSKKLAGINDFNNIVSDTFTFTSGTNFISFPGQVPEWFVRDKYFRVTAGGGSNNSSLLRVKAVDASGGIIEVYENIVDFTGAATFDGRIWAAINNPAIARPTSTGSTMYNVHNRTPTGLEDASSIALVFAEHYHDEPAVDEDEGEILVHLRNEVGGLSLACDSCTGEKYDIGPLVLVDRKGSVIRARVENPNNPCFPPEEECY